VMSCVMNVTRTGFPSTGGSAVRDTNAAAMTMRLRGPLTRADARPPQCAA
jgi:hypothetical protein